MANANQRIGEFVLESRIGNGTFGEVWKAHHHVWVDQLAAVKLPTDPSYVLSLQKEGATIQSLVKAASHPNIVRAIGFDPYADPPYLLMEYIPGTSLRPWIQQRKLSPADAVNVLKQVLAGLAHAHERGVIHRDIKPENILVHERATIDGFAAEGVVKVTDFGLGKAAAAMTQTSIAISASLGDAAGARIAGTLDYMAPEARQGSDVDGRVDLYACGVVLYEMLTGEKPAGTEVPSDLNPASPKWLDDIFRHSYTRLEKRYGSAREFLAALSSAAPTPPPLIQTLLTKSGDAVKPCPGCKKSVHLHDQFCMHCGVQLTASIRRCPKCGAFPARTDQFCMFCGETLTPAAGLQRA